MNEQITKPRRNCEMTFKIGADSYEDMLRALQNFVYMLEREHPDPDPAEGLHGVSGGYNSGYSWDITFEPEMTHDRYFELVDEMIAQIKQSKAGAS